MNDECGIEAGFLHSSFIVYQRSGRKRTDRKKVRLTKVKVIIMNKTLRIKSSNINIIRFMVMIVLCVFSMSGCRQANDLANANKATISNTAANTNPNANANSNANSNLTASSNANTEDKKSNAEIETIYTDLTEGKCKTTSEDESDVITQECPGVAGYKLEVAEHDAQKTINVLSPSGKTYSLDFQGKVSGGLSTLGEKAEWRVKKTGGKEQPVGLITRFNFSKSGDPNNLTSYLIVTKIDGDKVCITDIVKTKDANEKARQLADVAPTKPCL